MNINDIDPKIVGIVLRSYSEAVSKHSQQEAVNLLRERGMSQELISKVINYSHDCGKESCFESIMLKFESGEINFEDMAVSLLRVSIETTTKLSEGLCYIIDQHMSESEPDVDAVIGYNKRLN
jgi:hypothetical protein